VEGVVPRGKDSIVESLRHDVRWRHGGIIPVESFRGNWTSQQ